MKQPTQNPARRAERAPATAALKLGLCLLFFLFLAPQGTCPPLNIMYPTI